ncbi:C40 family peptidase [Halalkalibacter krulwichiae]|uniref:Peptidoglycan DL-endopeptidase CwlO n=1 Tax=Halalkalibacter krulwichiae TaxID=199441 RepID=A0A1X9MGT3_9BACI|nr:bifunctional lytic transglycosylase/C40 family peptidase [Halalkalibacter krulwichiae]ARK29642.1 Peptidoglycan DL-endopeptidase CwlO precursor [Halalkalibacter krulwichiae]
MSQHDFNDQEPQENKPSKTKEVGKQVGKILVKKAAVKGGATTLFNPYVLGGIAVVFLVLFMMIALYAFVIFFSTSPEDQGYDGYWGGALSEIGENEIPAEFIPIYQAAEQEYGVPWNLLAAIHRVETVFSTLDPMQSPVGAEGHTQFMPCTWVGWNHPSCSGLGAGNIPDHVKTDPAMIEKYGGYGVDASGNGMADPWDLEDAIFSAANYLAANGAATGDFEGAVFAYNRASWYVDDVLSYADRYVDGFVALDFDYLPSGVTNELVQVGTKWIGSSTYVFGGGRNQSDIAVGRFDCSSFIHWAFNQVGVEVGPLHSVTTDTLKHMGQSVPPSEMKPGDLVFFDTYKIDGHVGIYAGDGQFIGAQSSTGVAFVDMTSGYWANVFNGRVQRFGS